MHASDKTSAWSIHSCAQPYEPNGCFRAVSFGLQVEDCLVELLELGGAPYVLNELKQGDPLRLAVDLVRLTLCLLAASTLEPFDARLHFYLHFVGYI